MGFENYIPKQTDPQPKKAAGDLSSYTDMANEVPRGTVAGGRLSNVDLGAYKPWAPNGINSDFDINLKRAQDQGFWESTAKRIANLTPNILLGVAEGVGYLGSLITEWGDDRDYSNGITEAAKKYKNIFGEVFREHPDQVVDFTDPAWWGDMGQSLVESAASFALEGVGLAKVLGTLGELATATRIGAKIGKGIAAAEHLGTAALMAYTEGAMSGAQIYDEAYKAQYEEGVYKLALDPKDAHTRAKAIASNAAATTVQLNTVLNTVLNLGQLAPLFKHNDETLAWFRKNGKQQVGETTEQWKQRLADYSKDNPSITKLLGNREGLTSHTASAIAEGIEEVNTQFAEHRGREEGKQGKKNTSISDMAGSLSKYLDDTLNTEGALNMALGAFGGASQTVLLDHIPMHRVVDTDDTGAPIELKKNGVEVTDSNGNKKWQTSLRSSHYRNELGAKQYFDNVKDAVVKDIDTLNSLHTKLNQAIAKKDDIEAEKIKATMFNAMNLNSIQLGLAGAFKQQFADIEKLDNTRPVADSLKEDLTKLNDQIAAATDPAEKTALQGKAKDLMDNITKLGDTTEAMQKGFASNKTDNEYKERARDAVKDLEYYEKLWDTTNRKHSSPEDKETQIADYVFAKKAELYQRDRIIQRAEKELNTLRESNPKPSVKEAAIHNLLADYLTNTTTEEHLVETAQRIQRAATQAVSTDPAIKLQGLAVLREAAEKFMPVGTTEEDLWDAVEKHVVPKLNEQVTESRKKADEAVDNIATSPEYADWQAKNPDGDIGKYMKELHKTKYYDEILTKKDQQLDEFKAETEIANKNVAYLESAKGKANYYKMARESRRQLTKKLNEKIKKDNQTILSELYDKSSASKLSEVQRKQLAANVQRKIDEITKKIQDLDKNILDLRMELEKLLSPINLKERLLGMASSYTIKQQIKAKEQAKTKLQDQLSTLSDQLAVLTDPTLDPAAATTTVTPGPITTTPSSGNLEDDARTVFNNDLVFDRVIDEIYAQEVEDEATMLKTAETIMTRALIAIGHPMTSMSPADRADKIKMIQDYLKFIVQDIRSTAGLAPEETTVVPVPEPEVMLNTKTLTELIKELDPDLGLDVLMALNLYAGRIEKGEPYSLNFLKDEGFVGPGKLTLEQSAIIMNQFKEENSDIIKTIADNKAEITSLTPGPIEPVVVDTDTSSTSVVTPPADTAPVTITDIPTEDIHESEDTTTPGRDIAVSLDEELKNIKHDGIKTVDGFKVNVLTHNYDQRVISSNDKGLLYVNYSDYTMNGDLNPLYLTTGYIKEGTAMTLAIDEAFDGKVNETRIFQDGKPLEKPDKFQNYTTADNKIKEDDESIGNIPIKIIDPRTGETLGYLPRVDWLTAQYEGSSNYRNVVDTIYDQEGKIIKSNNVADQVNVIMRARKKIVKAYNKGVKTLDTTVESRSRGIPLRTNAVLTKDSILDPNVKMAILQKGSVLTGKTTSDSSVIVPNYLTRNAEYGKQNILGIVIEDASGKKHFEPLWPNKISKSDLDMIFRVIEIYLSTDPAAKLTPEISDLAKAQAKDILDNTGFDITNTEGLAAFLNQYYHFPKNFTMEQLKATGKSLGEGKPAKAVPKFMLDVGELKAGARGKVRAGITHLDRLAVAGIDSSGRLKDAFKDMLSDESLGLASKYKNIVFENSETKLKGINSTGKFIEPVYHPTSGKISFKEHASYNDFVKNNTRTTLYGKNKLPGENGNYVYFAHPNTKLNFNELMAVEVLTAKNIEPAITDMITQAKVEPITKIATSKVNSNQETEFIKEAKKVSKSANTLISTASQRNQTEMEAAKEILSNLQAPVGNKNYFDYLWDKINTKHDSNQRENKTEPTNTLSSATHGFSGLPISDYLFGTVSNNPKEGYALRKISDTRYEVVGINGDVNQLISVGSSNIEPVFNETNKPRGGYADKSITITKPAIIEMTGDKKWTIVQRGTVEYNKEDSTAPKIEQELSTDQVLDYFNKKYKDLNATSIYDDSLTTLAESAANKDSIREKEMLNNVRNKSKNISITDNKDDIQSVLNRENAFKRFGTGLTIEYSRFNKKIYITDGSKVISVANIEENPEKTAKDFKIPVTYLENQLLDYLYDLQERIDNINNNTTSASNVDKADSNMSTNPENADTPATNLDEDILADALNINISDAEATSIEDDLTDADQSFDSLPADMSSQIVNVVGSIDGQELSLENLTKVFNFTPVENRNGRTPLEVLNEMKRLGIPRIAPNYNPFYSC